MHRGEPQRQPAFEARLSPRIAAALRAAVSVSILVVILSRTSLEELAARAKQGTLAPLAAAAALYLLMVLLVALRWRVLALGLGLPVAPALAVRAVFLGLFGGQVLPSSLGTDVLRGWVVTRQTGRIERVAASLIADRLAALVAACVLVGLTFPVVFAGVAVALATLWLPRLRALLPPAGPILGALAIAVLIHAIAVAAAALTAAAYGVDASLATWLAIIPLSIIASAVPVSVNGWGVRETVIVALAAGQGIAQVDALLVSLTLGALNVVASLPGGYVLLAARRS